MISSQKSLIKKLYLKNGLIPFGCGIGWNTQTKKKELILQLNWINATNENYKDFIKDTQYKSKKKEIINISNGLCVRMGTRTKDGYYIIGLDIDNKIDTPEVKNGLLKWKDLLNDNNILNYVSIDTLIQQTGNKGFHYFFLATEEQYKNIKNITGLNIDGVEYSIDLKANENSFLIVEPTQYKDEYDNNKHYVFLNNNKIALLPEWIYNLIKIKEKKEKIMKPKEDEPTENKPKEPKIFNNELEDIKPYFKFLSVEKRLNNYQSWFIIACLIKSLYGKKGINILLEISKKSKHYINDEWIINKYTNEIKKRPFTINSFYYFFKKDNPIEYQKFIKFRKSDNKLLVNNIIEINNPYLLELDDNLDKDTILNNNIDEFFNNENIKSFNLKSPYDTGKTQLIKKYIMKYKPQKFYGFLIGCH